MSGELEAGGALITAGLASKAIQDSEGHGHGEPGPCINCGAVITGKFCGNCGQPAHIHRTLGHMFEETLHGVLHFDGRFWRTLPKLVLRPGTLTHDHIVGRRARYVSPLAAFLFTVFLMFFVFAMVGERAPTALPPSLSALEDIQSKQAADLAAANAELAAAQAELDSASDAIGADQRERLREAVADKNERARELGADLRETDALISEERERIEGLKAALAQLEKSRAETPEADAGETVKFDVAKSIIERALANPAGVTPHVEATIEPDGGVTVNNTEYTSGMDKIFDEIREANASGDLKVNTGNKTFDKKLTAKLENPELAWYKIENSAYKFSFLLVPLSLPFVWLVFFWKKGVTLFDHSVFILYSLTFMSLLFMVLAIGSRGPGWLQNGVLPWFTIVPPVHMFFQLKGTYSLGWFSALWRTVFLQMAALICLILFAMLIVFFGLLG